MVRVVGDDDGVEVGLQRSSQRACCAPIECTVDVNVITPLVAAVSDSYQ
jgi:hypothetical protein